MGGRFLTSQGSIVQVGDTEVYRRVFIEVLGFHRHRYIAFFAMACSVMSLLS